jgi:hypothetical protein
LSVIHDASARADHEHSRSVWTLRFPVPPVAGTAGAGLLTLTAHFVADGAVTLVDEELPQLTVRTAMLAMATRAAKLGIAGCT